MSTLLHTTLWHLCVLVDCTRCSEYFVQLFEAWTWPVCMLVCLNLCVTSQLSRATLSWGVVRLLMSTAKINLRMLGCRHVAPSTAIFGPWTHNTYSGFWCYTTLATVRSPQIEHRRTRCRRTFSLLSLSFLPLFAKVFPEYMGEI